MPALFFLLLLSSSTTAISARPDAQSSSSSSLVAASCARGPYPSLCVRTLAPSSPHSPTDLAIASAAATHSSVRSALSSLRRIPSHAGPLRDCLQQLSDSADQLSRTKAELSSLRSETSRMQLDNARTWASAALTNEDTCLDGMKAAGDVARSVKEEVSGKVREVERLTSNALYFVTRLASSSSMG